MDHDVKLGNLRAGDEQRDAIHIAVAPVIAGERLEPGTRVGFSKEGNTEIVTRFGNPIGIVDPFLTEAVEKGDKFWLCLFPDTITSLRHQWVHPAFTTKSDQDDVLRKDLSEKWLRDYTDGHDCPGYETILAVLRGETPPEDVDDLYPPTYTVDGEYFHCNGTDAHGDIPDEFWDHVEVLLGRPCNVRPKRFSCSC